MNTDQVLELVASVTGLQVTDIVSKNRAYYICTARYVAFIIMEEEGIKATDKTRSINISRSMYYAVKKVATARLQYDKMLKGIYLECIHRISDMEEQTI